MVDYNLVSVPLELVEKKMPDIVESYNALMGEYRRQKGLPCNNPDGGDLVERLTSRFECLMGSMIRILEFPYDSFSLVKDDPAYQIPAAVDFKGPAGVIYRVSLREPETGVKEIARKKTFRRVSDILFRLDFSGTYIKETHSVKLGQD